MQIIITTGTAILLWCLSICYLQYRKSEKIKVKNFLSKKKIAVLAGYIVLGAGIGWLYKGYGFSPMLTLEYTGILYVMLLIAYMDKKEWLIPNNLLIIMTMFGICCISVRVCTREIQAEAILWACIVGALIGGGTFLAGYFISKGSLGLGDVKLMGVLGFLLGDNVILVCMLLSLILSAVVGVLGIFRKKKTMKDAMPFAPFVAASVFILLIAGI